MCERGQKTLNTHDLLLGSRLHKVLRAPRALSAPLLRGVNYMMQKKVKIICIDVGSKINEQMCLQLITIGRWPLETHPPILNQRVTSRVWFILSLRRNIWFHQNGAMMMVSC